MGFYELQSFYQYFVEDFIGFGGCESAGLRGGCEAEVDEVVDRLAELDRILLFQHNLL